MVLFLATTRSNYSREAANFLANLKSNFSERLAYIATENRTVNFSGRVGKGNPLDMAIEHHNLILKSALRSCGGKTTKEHLTTISLSSQELQEAAGILDRDLLLPLSRGSHKVPENTKDVAEVSSLLTSENVFKKIPGRRIHGKSELYKPPFSAGMEIAIGRQWIRQYIFKKLLLKWMTATST